MTTLSIEDLKAWLELLPKVTPGPWSVDRSEGTKIKDADADTFAWLQHTHLRGRREDDEVVSTAAHIAKCDPATIAALIEGYIAMAEALSTFMDEHDNTYDGDPLSEGMSVFISKARSALNTGGTND